MSLELEQWLLEEYNEGLEEGEYQVAIFWKRLKADGRFQDFYNAIEDKNAREKLYKEYSIKCPVEWIMDRYQVSTHKESGITNDPNDWAIEHGKPRYILDLLLSVMTVSLKTQEIVNSLPEIKFE